MIVMALALAGCSEPSKPGFFEQRQATAAQQQQAVQFIEQHGGGVTWQDPGATVFLHLNDADVAEQQFAATQNILSLHTLTLVNHGLSAKQLQLASLGTLPGVENLVLQDVPLSPETLAWIGSLPSLRGLSLIDTGVTGEQLQAIAGMQRLQRLTLARESVTDADLRVLHDAAGLRRLRLSHTQVTPEAAAQLTEISPALIVEFDDQRLRGIEAPE